MTAFQTRQGPAGTGPESHHVIEPRHDSSSIPRHLRTFRPTGDLPEELVNVDQWIVWRYSPANGSGKPGKLPCTPQGGALLRWQNDPGQWMTFDAARAAYDANENLAGIGFVLTADSGIVGIDMDHVIDPATGEVADWALEHVKDFGTYTEVSPSGQGLRMFVLGRLPDGCRLHVGQREVYDRTRYLTVTGNVYGEDAPMRSAPEALGRYLAAMHAEGMNGAHGPAQAATGPLAADPVVSVGVVAELRSALAHLRADDYEQWVAVGHALHELGEVGRGLWIDWAQTSEKWQPADAQRWKTFTGDRTGYKAVFARAQGQGWVNPNAGTAPRASASKPAEPLQPPLPLPKLPPVPEFPIEILPDAMQRWIADAAQRAQFSPDLAAASAMAALGSVLGRKVGIRLKCHDDWTEYANIWGAIVGPPSALKSPAMREGERALKALQATADAKFAKKLAAHEVELEKFNLRKEAKKAAAKKALKKNMDAEIELGDEGEKPEAPVPQCYWTSNVNEASLGVLLKQNPDGLLIERDELSALLLSLEDDTRADLRGMLLSGWSGKEGYRFDRIMRGVILLPKFAVSMLGAIQPGPLARYVRSAFSGERADGLLQRFQLLVWPDPAAFEYVDRYPDKSSREEMNALFARADGLVARDVGERDKFGDDPPHVHLSPAAQERFTDWYSQFMQSQRRVEMTGEISAPLAAHFGKYPGLIGKLALILHVADDPASGQVSDRTLLKALAWVDYLKPHAERVYHAVGHPETGAADLLLARIKRGEMPQTFKSWEISRKGWHGLADAATVKRTCRLLFEYRWLVERDPGGATGGRPADPIYAVSTLARP